MDPSDRAVEQIQKRRAAIRQKIHPALPEMFERVRAAEKAWKALKKSDQTRERLGEIERKLDGELETIKRKHSGRAQAPKGTFGVEAVFREETLASQSDATAVVEYLHWNRHKRSLTRDVQQMQSKDYEASKRVQRTFQDSEMLRCNQGPLKPFKGGRDGTDHWDFLVMGWGLGLEKLTPEELADFANEHCLCGRNNHSPDNLKQQRIRVSKAIKAQRPEQSEN